MKIGFTCGAFDIMHAGHVLMFKECKEKYCDYLIVGLHSNPTIDRPDMKNKPIQSLGERRIQLEGCKYIDELVEYNTEEDLKKLLITLKYDVRIIGADWTGKAFTGFDIPGHMEKVVYNSRNHYYSTSYLRKRILEAGEPT